MYPGYILCERQKKLLFEIGKLIFEIRKQVLCKHLCLFCSCAPSRLLHTSHDSATPGYNLPPFHGRWFLQKAVFAGGFYCRSNGDWKLSLVQDISFRSGQSTEAQKSDFITILKKKEKIFSKSPIEILHVFSSISL